MKLLRDGTTFTCSRVGRAGLIGLTFVVIALLSDARRANPAGMQGYITRTIVHFGTVFCTCCVHERA